MLAGLKALHAAGLAHCDVRPSNVVTVDDVAAGGGGGGVAWRGVLIDLGLSRSIGSDCCGVGVALFTAPGVFPGAVGPGGRALPVPACPALDLQAAAYTWCALARGAGGGAAAPWPEDGRDTWLLEAAADASARGDPFWATLLERLADLDAQRGSSAVDASYYTWPWAPLQPGV